MNLRSAPVFMFTVKIQHKKAGYTVFFAFTMFNILSKVLKVFVKEWIFLQKKRFY